MDELSKSFRPTKGFFICWAAVACGLTVALRKLRIDMPWYSWVGIIALLSAGSSFFFYGPVLLLADARKNGISGTTLLWRIAVPVVTLILVSVGLIFVSDLRTKNEALSLGLIGLISGIAVWYVGYSIKALTKK